MGLGSAWGWYSVSRIMHTKSPKRAKLKVRQIVELRIEAQLVSVKSSVRFLPFRYQFVMPLVPNLSTFQKQSQAVFEYHQVRISMLPWSFLGPLYELSIPAPPDGEDLAKAQRRSAPSLIWVWVSHPLVWYPVSGRGHFLKTPHRILLGNLTPSPDQMEETRLGSTWCHDQRTSA